MGNNQVHLGKLKITATWPMQYDGLHMGWDKHTVNFEWRTDGFAFNGKLYLTHDPTDLIEAFGLQDAEYKFIPDPRIMGR